MEKNEKEIILQLLSKEPRGLTIQEISRLGKMSRFTATIYVHELLGEGKVTERRIGAYKLFKLKKNENLS
jgi:DNA-binding IclR family transcriptional regulator